MRGLDSKSRVVFKQKSKTKLGPNPSNQLLEAFTRVFEEHSVSTVEHAHQHQSFNPVYGWLHEKRRTSGAMQQGIGTPQNESYVYVDDSAQWLEALTPKEEISWPPNIPATVSERHSSDRHLLTIEHGDEDSSSADEPSYTMDQDALSPSSGLQWGTEESERQSILAKRSEGYRKDRPWLQTVGPTLISKSGEVPEKRCPTTRVSAYIRSADEGSGEDETIRPAADSSFADAGIRPGKVMDQSRKPAIGTRDGQSFISDHQRHWGDENDVASAFASSEDLSSLSAESDIEGSSGDGDYEAEDISHEGSFYLGSPTLHQHHIDVPEGPRTASPIFMEEYMYEQHEENTLMELRERLERLKRRLVQADPLIEQKLISLAIDDASIRMADEDPAGFGSFESVYNDATSNWANMAIRWHKTTKQVFIGFMLVCLLSVVFMVASVYYSQSKLFNMSLGSHVETVFPEPAPTSKPGDLSVFQEVFTTEKPQEPALAEPDSGSSTTREPDGMGKQPALPASYEYPDIPKIEEDLQPGQLEQIGIESLLMPPPTVTSQLSKLDVLPQFEHVPTPELLMEDHIDQPLLFYPSGKFFQNPLVALQTPTLSPAGDMDNLWRFPAKIKPTSANMLEEKAVQANYQTGNDMGNNQLVIEVEQKYPSYLKPMFQKEKPNISDLKAILSLLERERPQRDRFGSYGRFYAPF